MRTGRQAGHLARQGGVRIVEVIVGAAFMLLTGFAGSPKAAENTIALLLQRAAQRP